MKIRIKSLDDIRDNENITIEHDGESISLQLEVIEWLVGYYGSDIEIDGEEYDLSEYFTLDVQMPEPRKGSPARFTLEIYYKTYVIAKYRQGYPIKFNKDELEYFSKRGYQLESSWNSHGNDPSDDDAEPMQDIDDWF